MPGTDISRHPKPIKYCFLYFHRFKANAFDNPSNEAKLMITNDGVLTKGGKHLEKANTNLSVFQTEPLTART